MILVTGGTGNIGKEVIKGLSAAGAKVRALVRNPDKATDLKLPGVEIVKGDLADPSSLTPAFQGVDKAFLVTNAGPDQVKLHHAFVEAAKKANVKQVVKVSALGADTNSKINLAKWHGQGEAELKNSGIGWTILEPTSFMQNALMNAGTIKSQGAFYAPAKPESKVSMVDTRDIAAVAVRSLLDEGHLGKTYVITGGEAVSFLDQARALSEVCGKQIKFVQVPPDQAKKNMLGAGMPSWLVDDMIALMAFMDTGAGAATTDVVTRIGKKKPITFAQFAQDFGSAFR